MPKKDKKPSVPKEKTGFDLPVVCARCARIYMYRNQTEARCPKCAFNRWLDIRALVRESRTENAPGAQKQLLELLWRAADFVETDDINEDVA